MTVYYFVVQVVVVVVVVYADCRCPDFYIDTLKTLC
jgi:hypothetical protein